MKSPSSLRFVRSLAVAGLVLLAGCFNRDQPPASTFGANSQLYLQSVLYGRLVDVVDVDDVLVEQDVLIRPDLVIDGISYELSTNPLTQEETLKILQPRSAGGFTILLNAAKTGLEPLDRKGAFDPPPYTMVPRNAAIQLRFSDQLDPATVTPSSIQVFNGAGSNLEELTVRMVVKNDRRTRTGIVILDPTISARESATLGLPANPTGWPASLDGVNDNIKIRIPTEKDLLYGQPVVLTNLKGNRTIKNRFSDPIETSGGGFPVLVQVFRAGNDQDEFRGFLEDLIPPKLIGIQDVTVAEVAAPNGTSSPIRELTYSIDTAYCRDMTPKPGDVFDFSDALLLVTAVLSSGNPAAYVVRGRMLEPADPASGLPPGTGLSLAARLNTAYTIADANLQVCYLGITPDPVYTPGQPLALDPFNTQIRATFSEPIDPRTVTSMHSFVVTAFEMDDAFGAEAAYYRHPTLFPTESVADYIDRQRGYHLKVGPTGTLASSEFGGRVLFGPLEADIDSRSFALTPLTGMAEPNSDPFLQFAVALRGGPDGITDMAGNPVDLSGFVAGTPLPSVAVENQLTVVGGGGLTAANRTKAFSLRANGLDEDDDGQPEYTGQVGYQTGKLTGRAAEGFSRDADNTNQYVGAGISVNASTVPVWNPPYAPLSPAGAVVMTTIRPHDLGFGYRNLGEFNLDVAGMSWVPLGGVVFDDLYPRFSLALAHAKYMPDEQVINGVIIWPFSGLVTESFDANILGYPDFDEKIVFDSSYSISSLNLFTSDSGNTMLPLPDFQDTYTWRDTTIPPSYTGTAESPLSIGAATSTHPDAGLYGAGKAPSIALPLLARFRCYPRGERLGTNKFQTTALLTQNVQTSVPAFRIYSEGGQDASGQWHQVIPDNAAKGGTQPVGGYVVGTGQPTDPTDPLFYWTEVDFVLKVSRVYTHWFDMGGTLGPGQVVGVQLEPEIGNQPVGTSVQIEYRGAVQVDHPNNPTTDPSPLLSAATGFGFYGDYDNASGQVSTPGDWTSDFTDLEGHNYRFLQIRITFVNDVDRGNQAVLDGLGLAWRLG
ncbi:MAG: hypothetical protein D6702_09690 [Planctomycetota bacterium]|nr:MAG: hypothetical protein D6702_09690 [Planctomycetota bacterium]